MEQGSKQERAGESNDHAAQNAALAQPHVTPGHEEEQTAPPHSSRGSVARNKKLWTSGGIVLIVAAILLVVMMRGTADVPESMFPLPDTVRNFTEQNGGTQINFQTDLTIEEVLSFYRAALPDQEFIERELLTVMTSETLNLVFDGHESGEAIVVQAAALPDGMTNVNVRLEAI